MRPLLVCDVHGRATSAGRAIDSLDVHRMLAMDVAHGADSRSELIPAQFVFFFFARDYYRSVIFWPWLNGGSFKMND